MVLPVNISPTQHSIDYKGTYEVVSFDSLECSDSFSTQRIPQHVVDHISPQVDILKRSLSSW